MMRIVSISGFDEFNTLVNQRVVYGGGGIMPDIFIPLDTTYNTSYSVG